MLPIFFWVAMFIWFLLGGWGFLNTPTDSRAQFMWVGPVFVLFVLLGLKVFPL